MSLIISGIRLNITAIGLIRPNGTRILKSQILKFQKSEMPPPPHFVLKYYQRHQEGPKRRMRQVNLIFKQCKCSPQFTSTQITRCALLKFTIRFVWFTFNSVVGKRSSKMRLIYTYLQNKFKMPIYSLILSIISLTRSSDSM